MTVFGGTFLKELKSESPAIGVKTEGNPHL